MFLFLFFFLRHYEIYVPSFWPYLWFNHGFINCLDSYWPRIFVLSIVFLPLDNLRFDFIMYHFNCPLNHLNLIWIASLYCGGSMLESTWFTSDFHTVYSRFYFINVLRLNMNLLSFHFISLLEVANFFASNKYCVKLLWMTYSGVMWSERKKKSG